MRLRLTAVVRFALAAAAVSLTTALSPDASAQQPDARSQPPAQSARPSASREGTGAQSSRANERDASADLSITARVTADSLRFEKVPNTRVEFTGRPERETVWEAERENLPEQVQPGVTYRNVGITLRIVSVFADIDRIVAEALGEVPANDEARPTAPTPEQPAAAPATPPASNITPPTTAAADTRRRRPARRGRVN